MNYYIQDFCCICLNISSEKCSNKSSKYPDNLAPFDKIKTIFLELSAVMDNENRICKKCSGIVDLIYEFHKTCLKNSRILSSYKKVLRENKLKKQCHLFVNLDESEQFKEDTMASKGVKVELRESPLNNDDTFCDTDLVTEGHSFSNAAAGIKVEVDMNNEAFNEECQTSWLGSEMKIEIEETYLEKEWVDVMNETSEHESLKPNVEDFENNSYQSTGEAANEEEVNRELREDVLLEVAEKKSHKRQVHRESSGENPSKSPREKPVDEEKEDLDCSEYGETLSSKSDMNRHMMSHSKRETQKWKKSRKCDICGKLFPYMSHLKHHKLIHTGEKAYKCNICDKLFTYKGNLRAHILTHTDEKPHKCNICEKSFIRKTSLRVHMLTHTGEKSHKCDICGKLFNQNAYLKTHMLIHTGEKSHICDICGKLFNQNSHLKSHKLTHTNIKRHKCNICEKLFTSKSSLRPHMLIHTGEKRHKCDICGKLFSQNAHLKSHLLTHTGEKPNKCDICEKLFTQKCALKTHMLIHTGEKPHKCDTCGKSYTQKINLTRHMFTHSDRKIQ